MQHEEKFCGKCTLGWLHQDLPVGDPEFGKLLPCECQTQQRVQKLQKISRLSPRELSIHLEDIDIINRPGTNEMVQACRGFLKYPYMILTIWGPSGNAKTTALMGTINHLTEMNRGAIYVTLSDIIADIQSTFNQNKEMVDDNALTRLQSYEQITFLAIDEFEKARRTDWVLEQLTHLMDKRYQSALSGESGTIIAMNTNPAAEATHIFSRLRDGRNKIIYNADSDLRPLM